MGKGTLLIYVKWPPFDFVARCLCMQATKTEDHAQSRELRLTKVLRSGNQSKVLYPNMQNIASLARALHLCVAPTRIYSDGADWSHPMPWRNRVHAQSGSKMIFALGH